MVNRICKNKNKKYNYSKIFAHYMNMFDAIWNGRCIAGQKKNGHLNINNFG